MRSLDPADRGSGAPLRAKGPAERGPAAAAPADLQPCCFRSARSRQLLPPRRPSAALRW